MPAVTNPVSTGNASQIQLAQAPPTNQYNFRELVGKVLWYNPDAPVPLVKQWVNDSYRRIIDRRNWYGLLIKGQVVCPTVYSTGQATVTIGSTAVTGVGTNWTDSMIGSSFRTGFMTPFSIITSVTSATALTLDLPWGGPTAGPTGYSIFLNIVSLGSNIKRVLQMVNQRQGWSMLLNMPQDVINLYDTWRTYMGWTGILASFVASPTGQPQYELYPVPTYQQAFPYIAYTDPGIMRADTDFPATYIRGDVIVYGAIADALMFKGKTNKYYDPTNAQVMFNRFTEEAQILANSDDNLYPSGFQWNYAKGPYTGYGSTWAISHAVGSGGGDHQSFSWE